MKTINGEKLCEKGCPYCEGYKKCREEVSGLINKCPYLKKRDWIKSWFIKMINGDSQNHEKLKSK